MASSLMRCNADPLNGTIAGREVLRDRQLEGGVIGRDVVEDSGTEPFPKVV